ncbi:MAG: hypothetical protein DRJ42_24300 [Deltaproteobacteria bacterium]|nr:MAG: hypothetical protein DRJ42_24300 [Deltaproteobacteria bacterium]
MKDVFSRDEVDEVLRGSFYRKTVARPSVKAPTKRARKKTTKKAAKKKPDHYEVICISMYKDDLGRLDDAVKRLKASGHRKMSRSALIRFALDTMDTDALPKSY